MIRLLAIPSPCSLMSKTVLPLAYTVQTQGVSGTLGWEVIRVSLGLKLPPFGWHWGRVSQPHPPVTKCTSLLGMLPVQPVCFIEIGEMTLNQP
jgi:hypothetical protein